MLDDDNVTVGIDRLKPEIFLVISYNQLICSIAILKINIMILMLSLGYDLCFFLFYIVRKCSLQYQGEFVVHDTDYERVYKSTLDSCKSDCLNSTQCRAMYHIRGYCFIVYKDTLPLHLVGSAFFQKVCTGIYCKFDICQSSSYV